jgi:ATP-binding cassette subfamily B protein
MKKQVRKFNQKQHQRNHQHHNWQKAADAPNLPNNPFRFVCHFVNQFRWLYVVMISLEALHAICGIMLPYAIGEIMRGVTRATSQNTAVLEAMWSPFLLFAALSIGEVLFGRTAGLTMIYTQPLQRQNVLGCGDDFEYADI